MFFLVAKALCTPVAVHAVDFSIADRFLPEPCEAVPQRIKCKQLQERLQTTAKHVALHSRSLFVHVVLTPFNAHRCSLSSVADTAMHGSHLQDYTTTNLCAIEYARSAHLRPS